MDPKDILLEVSKKIDSITYTDTPRSQRKVKDIISIGWENVLPSPPANTSDITKRELQYLSRLTLRLDFRQKELVKLVDKEPLDLFSSIIRKNDLKFDRESFRDLYYGTFDPVILNLKSKYNRARPDQLAPAFGMKVDVITTDTHQTPAYPSGHTAYTAFAAYLLAAMYPDLSSSFFGRIGLAGYARCLQGVHYPSDNDASMVISGALWENVKYELYPELFPEKY